MKRSKPEELAMVLRALGDKKRLAILCALLKKPKSCVSEIANRTRGSIAITSHHLHGLAKAGLLVPHRTGKRICYVLRDTDLSRDIKTLICKYHHDI